MDLINKLPLVHKLVEKKTLGYTCTTTDFVTFVTSNESSLLRVESIGQEDILIDLTPKNIEIISEFIRYVKTDMERDA